MAIQDMPPAEFATRRIRGAAASPGDDELRRIKAQLHHRLVFGMDFTVLGGMDRQELIEEVRRAADDLCAQSSFLLSRQEQDRLVKEVLDETFGMGPLEPLMNDPGIMDILINGPHAVYVERRGQLEPAPIEFHDATHLQHIVGRLVGQSGRRVDETSPMVDCRLPDGSRLNAIIPPVAIDGAMVSIRRFSATPIRAADMVANKTAPAEMLEFLSACVAGRLNILVSGGTGSGKTTLLNVLSAFIPENERIITIEDAAELRLQQLHVGRLETRPKNTEGAGEITTRDLLRNALRMRPDRIIVGECRGPEAIDMLQAMNTGHEGSLTTIHANDVREALGRLEIMVGMSGFDLPIWVIRRQIASAIHLVVQTTRLLGGARKIVKVSEVVGIEGENFVMQDIFVFKQTGVDHERRAQGCFQATGIRPHCLERLESMGYELSRELFERRSLQPASRPLA
jgi:pilus assembly protein CpaF